MSIIDGFITATSGTFTTEKTDVTVEWLIFSDDLNDFCANISLQGVTDSDNLVVDNKAVGWFPPGKAYQMGNDSMPGCFAAAVEISERKIIRGTGDYQIELSNGTVALVPVTPQGIARYKAVQKFSTKEPEQNESSENQEPSSNDKWSLSTDTEYKELPFERDKRNNEPVVNSAGQKFNPPPMYRKAITVYSLSRTEFVNPIAKCREYRNVVNSDVFHGAAPGTVLMDSISPSKEKDGVWNVTYKFKYDPDTWAMYILDTGTMQRDENGKLKAVLDADSKAVQEPVKLNGSGKPLANQNVPGTDVGPFWAYEAKPFTALNIPDFSRV